MSIQETFLGMCTDGDLLGVKECVGTDSLTSGDIQAGFLQAIDGGHWSIVHELVGNVSRDVVDSLFTTRTPTVEVAVQLGVRASREARIECMHIARGEKNYALLAIFGECASPKSQKKVLGSLPKGSFRSYFGTCAPTKKSSAADRRLSSKGLVIKQEALVGMVHRMINANSSKGLCALASQITDPNDLKEELAYACGRGRCRVVKALLKALKGQDAIITDVYRGVAKTNPKLVELFVNAGAAVIRFV
jgi:hypothetical protein